MEASTVPQVQKREFKNNTAGWLGVVVIDARGEEKGVSVEPYGTVWLSEAEQILTARAPRRPEDNPFVEQTFIGVDDDGQRGDFQMRPLVPADTDPRYVPTQDRYVPPVPSTPAEQAVHAAAAAQDRVVTSPEAARVEAAVLAAPPVQGGVAGVAPSEEARAAAAQAAAPPHPVADPEDPESRPSWTEPPPAPGEVLKGSLRGSNEPSPTASAAAAPDPAAPPVGAPVVPPQAPAPQAPPQAPAMTAAELAGDIREPTPELGTTFGTPPGTPQAAAPPVPAPAVAGPPSAAEEHAAVDPAIGEETGAARPPAGTPVEGEYASREEIGSPDAPKAPGSAQPPAEE